MKLTQEELAEPLNVTPQAVSRWENEASLPDITLVPRISNVLGLSCDTLLKEKEERSVHFAPAGITVDTAECMIQNDIDMLLLDINMPGYNGLEVLEQVKKDYPDLPVLMLSAVADEKTVRETLRLGARGFVAKPFAAEKLVEYLRRV